MSSPLDPESIPPQVKDGVVAGVLGGLAMVARLLLSTEPVTFGWVARRVGAAAITAALVGYGVQDHIASPGLRMAVVGASGYAAPECLDYLMRAIKARAEKEVGQIEKGVRPNAKRKGNGKRKR